MSIRMQETAVVFYGDLPIRPLGAFAPWRGSNPHPRLPMLESELLYNRLKRNGRLGLRSYQVSIPERDSGGLLAGNRGHTDQKGAPRHRF